MLHPASTNSHKPSIMAFITFLHQLLSPHVCVIQPKHEPHSLILFALETHRTSNYLIQE